MCWKRIPSHIKLEFHWASFFLFCFCFVFCWGRGGGHILCILEKENTEKSKFYLLLGNNKYSNGQNKRTVLEEEYI